MVSAARLAAAAPSETWSITHCLVWRDLPAPCDYLPGVVGRATSRPSVCEYRPGLIVVSRLSPVSEELTGTAQPAGASSLRRRSGAGQTCSSGAACQCGTPCSRCDRQEMLQAWVLWQGGAACTGGHVRRLAWHRATGSEDGTRSAALKKQSVELLTAHRSPTTVKVSPEPDTICATSNCQR